MSGRAEAPCEIVLVGGGHAHVRVLERWAKARPRGIAPTLVVDDPIAVYSGMVPGHVAGQYDAAELEIDVRPLARRAGARVVVAAATGLEPADRRVLLEGRPPIPYDVAALDVGSTVAGLDLPGVRRHALPTRPIRSFVERAGTLDARLSPGSRIVVAGGGAAGVELAFTLESRQRRRGELAEPSGGRVAGPGTVHVVESSPELLPGAPGGLVRRVRREMAQRGIRVHAGRRIVAVEPHRLLLDGGDPIAFDLLLWALGAAPPALLANASLPLDERGFVRVRPTLQVVGHDEIFASGDCASFEGRDLPKAGVHAVRQGPTLERNLRAVASGTAPREHRPQRDFLVLLNLGDGRALGSKWGLSAGGRALFRLKDWLDRRFVERHRVPGEDEIPG